MELKCKFYKQLPIVERSNWKSRKVWVITEDNPDYPQTIEIEVSQDKINLFDSVKDGQSLTLQLNLKGREWTNPQGEVKVFNTLSCWKLSKEEIDNVVSNLEKHTVNAVEDLSDLPF